MSLVICAPDVDPMFFFRITNKMEGVALITFFEKVAFREGIPVFVLVLIENTCPFAKRTHAVEGEKDRRTDELRSVLNTQHSFCQRFINLECYNFLFFSPVLFSAFHEKYPSSVVFF